MQLMRIHSILKIIAFHSLLLLFPYGISAQSTFVGTFSEADSIIIYALGNQAFSLRRSNPDSALLLANQALVRSEKLENLPSQVSLWRIKGLVYYGLKQYNKALENYDIALKLARESEHGIGIVLNSLGNTYFSQQDYAAAVEIYEEAAQYAASKKDTITLLDALNNLGSTYTNSGDFDAAIPYYEQSLALQRAINFQKVELHILRNIGWLYVRKNDLKKGLEVLQHGKELAIERNDSAALSLLYRSIGFSYKQYGLFENSLAAYQEALKIAETVGNKKIESDILVSIADIYRNANDLDKALNLLKKGLSIA